MNKDKFFVVVDADGDHIDCEKYETKQEAVNAAMNEVSTSSHYVTSAYYVAEIVAKVTKPLRANVVDL